MNKLVIYTIRDLKAEYFLPPFTMRNDAEATRAFGDSVAKGDTPLAAHPEDYQLFKVADIDLDTGVVSSILPVAVCLASDFVKETK